MPLGPFVCFLLGENLFLPTMLVCSACRSVCLSVSWSVCHTIFGKSFQEIVLNIFFVCVGDGTRTAMLNFGEDLNSDPDLRIFKVILHH